MIISALFSLLLAAPKAAPAPVEFAAAVPAKPPTRLLQRSLPGGMLASIRINPGVPEAGVVTRIIIELSRKGASGPLPIDGALLQARINADSKGIKDRKMRNALRRARPVARIVHRLNDRGSYGFQVTLPASGSYKVLIEGSARDNVVSFEFGLHPGLWPAPDLQTENVQLQSGRSRRPLRRR